MAILLTYGLQPTSSKNMVFGLSSTTRRIYSKRRRAQYFINKLDFSDDEEELIALVREYRYLSSEVLIALAGAETANVSRSLRILEEHCCIERRENYYCVAPPLRDAIRRDARFPRSSEWKKSVAEKVNAVIGEYENDDSISISVLEAGAVRAAKGADAPQFLANLILLSLLLRIARELYDNYKYVTVSIFVGEPTLTGVVSQTMLGLRCCGCGGCLRPGSIMWRTMSGYLRSFAPIRRDPLSASRSL